MADPKLALYELLQRWYAQSVGWLLTAQAHNYTIYDQVPTLPMTTEPGTWSYIFCGTPTPA